MSRLPTSQATDPLVTKAEIGVGHYLLHACDRVGLDWRLASFGGPAAKLPAIVISAGSQQTHPDLPPAAGIYLLEVEITLHWPSGRDGLRPGKLDDIRGDIECAMLNLDGAQAFLNLPTSGVDARPVDAFHLYDIEPSGGDLSFEGTTWVDTRSFLLTLCAADQVIVEAEVPSGNTGALFYRPDGTSLFRRPDTTSRFLRP